MGGKRSAASREGFFGRQPHPRLYFEYTHHPPGLLPIYSIHLLRLLLCLIPFLLRKMYVAPPLPRGEPPLTQRTLLTLRSLSIELHSVQLS